jgi:type IV pilus assembly protein PilM
MDAKQTELVTQFDGIVTTAQNLVSNVEGRLLWLELLKAIDSALPKDLRPAEERQETAEDVTQRVELHVTSMDCEYMDAAATAVWYQSVSPLIAEAKAVVDRPSASPPAAAAEDAAAEEDGAVEGDPPVDGEEEFASDPTVDSYADGMAVDESGQPMDGAAAAAGPTGPGWVIEFKGYHFHNSIAGVRLTNNEGKEFIERTFFKNLEEGSVELPDGPNGELVEVTYQELGIQAPVVITENPIIDVDYFPEAIDGEPNRATVAPMPMARGGRGVTSEEPVGPKVWKLRRYDFTIQFYWTPTPRTARLAPPASADGEAGDTAALGDMMGPTG